MKYGEIKSGQAPADGEQTFKKNQERETELITERIKEINWFWLRKRSEQDVNGWEIVEGKLISQSNYWAAVKTAAWKRPLRALETIRVN